MIGKLIVLTWKCTNYAWDYMGVDKCIITFASCNEKCYSKYVFMNCECENDPLEYLCNGVCFKRGIWCPGINWFPETRTNIIIKYWL